MLGSYIAQATKYPSKQKRDMSAESVGAKDGTE